MPSSGTAVERGVLAACAATAEELVAARRLITELENERDALHQRLATARRESDLLRELADTQARETTALTSALEAQKRAGEANAVVIEKQTEMIGELKRSRRSPWKRLGDILVGVAVGAVVR